MDMGVQGLNMGDTVAPAETLRLAQLVEQLGYRSWWASEHVVLPSPRVDPSPSEPDTPLLDPLVSLGFVAAATTRLELGTGIVILPMSVARLHQRKDVVSRLVTDLEPTTVALVWLVDRDDEVTQAFVGVTKGRTANTSR